MNELILIRHGESQYNAMLTDNLDSDLTAKGIEQAKATGKFLQENFGHIQDFLAFTSPYLRCLQTSKIIRDETGLEFIVTLGPREMMLHYNHVEIPTRKEEFPEFIWNLPCTSRFWHKNEKSDGWHFPQEDSEQYCKRILEFMNFSLPKHEKAIIISHGMPICNMYEIKLGLKPQPNTETYVGNASISYVRNYEGVWFGKTNM